MRLIIFGIFIIGIFYTSVSADSASKTTPSPQPLTALHSGTGTVTITANAHNPQIIINNMVLGSAPFSNSTFLPGFYHIEILHKDFRPYRTTVLLVKDSTVNLNVRLEPVNPNLPPPDTLSTQALTSDMLVDSAADAISSEYPPPILTTAVIKYSALSLLSNVEGTEIVINKVAAGKSPYFKDSLQYGFYEIEFKKEGYLPFRKIVQLSGGDTVTVQAALISQMSWLKVTSTPSNATVLLNSRRSGTTPFDSAQIMPGKYLVRVELDAYVASVDTIVLRKNATDSLHISLVSQAYQDSIDANQKRIAQLQRRIIFGTLTSATLTGVLVYNQKAAKQLDAEKIAWKKYQEHNLTAIEYDSRYAAYKVAKKKTDAQFENRQLFYILSALSASLLTVSIKF